MGANRFIINGTTVQSAGPASVATHRFKWDPETEVPMAIEVLPQLVGASATNAAQINNINLFTGMYFLYLPLPSFLILFVFSQLVLVFLRLERLVTLLMILPLTASLLSGQLVETTSTARFTRLSLRLLKK